MSDNHMLSIIIPHYNSADTLKRLFESIFSGNICPVSHFATACLDSDPSLSASTSCLYLLFFLSICILGKIILIISAISVQNSGNCLNKSLFFSTYVIQTHHLEN